jgi:serine/threonine-protein kinase RsbT
LIGEKKEMADALLFRKKFSVQAGDFAKAGEASVEIKNILKEVGFDPDVIRCVAIASYEAEMNTVMYSVGGDIDFIVKPGEVCLIFEDRGPGIPDISLAMREGYSTATDEMREMGFGAGMGLPNMKKNADRFTITSEVNRGTRIEMHFQRHK